MKLNHILLELLFVAFLVGCASTDEMKLDTTKREPSQSVEVYHFETDKPLPSKPYKVIATMRFQGALQDGPKSRNYFTNRAKQLGASAVIIERPENGGTQGGPYGSAPSFIYKAKAVVYQ